MEKNFSLKKDYSAYVVDMDGTLYYKRWMQIQVVLHLMCYYILHIHRIKELFILHTYRKLRDREEFANTPDFEQTIIQSVCQICHCSETLVKQTINEWILTRPIQMLYVARDRRLITFVNKQQTKKVLIYSDYPADTKCDALGVCASDIYWPDKRRISVLKPSSDGLEYILRDNQLIPSEVLFIGDRMEKDGLCAIGAGVDYLILKKSYLLRSIQYMRLRKNGGNDEKTNNT